MDPLGHGRQAPAGTGLVAEGPEDDRRVVLVPLDHAGRAVQQGRGPAVVVDGVVAPALLGETVGLQVALVDDPQPVLVAQVEEGRVRRVVRGAHGVEVVPLHQQHVLAHGLQVERAALLRVPLVPVDALEEDGPAVDLDEAVLEHDRAEADAQRHPLALGRQHTVVEVRRLRGPRPDRDRHRLAGRDIDVQGGHGHPPVDVGVDAQGALARDVVVGGVHEEVEDAARRAVQQGDVTEDAGQPPLVLVLQVGTRRPLVDADREHVAGRLQQMADRELVGQPGTLELTDVRAVQPDPCAGLDAVEPEHGAAVRGPVRRQVEDPQVVAGRVLGGDVRGVHGEGVEVVRVDRRPERPVPLEDPVPGDRDLGPVPGVVALLGERVVLGVGGRRHPQTPAAVQGQRGGVRGRVPGAGREGPAAG